MNQFTLDLEDLIQPGIEAAVAKIAAGIAADQEHEKLCEEVCIFLLGKDAPVMHHARCLVIALDKSVAAMHGQWDHLMARCEEWRKIQQTKAAPLQKELDALDPKLNTAASLPPQRARRKLLNDEIQHLRNVASLAAEAADHHWLQAVLWVESYYTQQWTKEGYKPASITPAITHLNELIQEPCWLEITWKWTINRCAAQAIKEAVIEHNISKKLLSKARRKDTKPKAK